LENANDNEQAETECDYTGSASVISPIDGKIPFRATISGINK